MTPPASPPLQAGGPCSHLGCSRPGRGCYLGEDARQVDDWLCGEHAGQYGYCCVCGVWAAGTVQFEQTRLCPVCADDPGW